jgi:hypothetical protein
VTAAPFTRDEIRELVGAARDALARAAADLAALPDPDSPPPGADPAAWGKAAARAAGLSLRALRNLRRARRQRVDLLRSASSKAGFAVR